MNDEELQRAYLRAAPQAPIGPHPDPERIADLVRGSGREADRLALLEHVMRCPACRRELDLLRAANEGARAADTSRFPVRWMAFAAAAVLVIGVTSVFLSRTRTPVAPDVYRGQRPALTLVEPHAGSTVAQPVHLAWQAVADARTYHIELLSEHGDMIAAWNTTDTALAIPDSVRLIASQSYDVWVRATLDDRTDVSSPIVRFSVK